MNEIQLAEKLPISNMADIVTMGNFLAQSNVFGINNPGDGFVIAATCYQQNISLMEFHDTYHMINGKPSKKADAMLVRLEELGGKYKIISKTGDKAEIEVEFKERKFKDSFTWEDAKQEKYVYQKDGKTPKNTWSTPRGRSQMLWARVVSNSIRTVCPQANKGSYTPEEVMDFVDEPEINITSSSKPIPTTTEKVKSAMKEAMIVVEAKTPAPERFPINEPDPFDKQIEAYEKCPVPGKLLGIKWGDMPLENLRIAETMKHDTLIKGHYKAINESIKIKELSKVEELSND